MACRKGSKSDTALEEIKSYSKNDRISLLDLDLSDIDSIMAFTNKVKQMNLPIDILINNAGNASHHSLLLTATGVMNYVYEQTKDGFESNIGVNHLGHFLLTLELLPILIQHKARIINLSSEMHQSCTFSLF
jgi:NAD(P)-dependent dehydrogenase (short-subunit alcohol dehydrogenase family)